MEVLFSPEYVDASSSATAVRIRAIDGVELGAFRRRSPVPRGVPGDQALERRPGLGDLDRLGDA